MPACEGNLRAGTRTYITTDNCGTWQAESKLHTMLCALGESTDRGRPPRTSGKTPLSDDPQQARADHAVEAVHVQGSPFGERMSRDANRQLAREGTRIVEPVERRLEQRGDQ